VGKSASGAWGGGEGVDSIGKKDQSFVRGLLSPGGGAREESAHRCPLKESPVRWLLKGKKKKVLPGASQFCSLRKGKKSTVARHRHQSEAVAHLKKKGVTEPN